VPQYPNIKVQLVWSDGQQPGERIQRVHAVRSYLSIRTSHADIKANFSFELCDLSGAPQAFFPGDRRAMYGNYQEVPCTSWQGSAGTPLWIGSCMADENAAFWPAKACGNEGIKRSLACTVM
jgi:hypothetical protein